MADITVPALGESVTEATVGRWVKAAGDAVKRDEVLLELETDKVALEVSAPEDGVLTIVAAEGATVSAGQILGSVGAGAQAAAKTAPKAAPAKAAKATPATATAAAPSGELEVGPAPAQPAPPEMPAASAAAAPVAAAPSAGGGIDITVPTMGESVSEGAVGRWTKNPGGPRHEGQVRPRSKPD
jgi:2-oxoglutarate dehydrogenase E2 component (dihydrolipoamide succinyltransferase)